jgi:flagellar hook protein FlgE
MLRSLFSGISGLRAHQQMMDVTGNNIANVNSIGYKSSQTIFEDTLSQMLRGAGAPQTGPNGSQGGTNPAQVGLGVRLAGINTNFVQGSAQSTGRPTDLMVSGDGFFIVDSVNEQLFTRAGAFNFDADGRLVTPTGAAVQGWPAANGVVNTAAPLGDIRLPMGTQIAPTPTGQMVLSGNLEGTLTAGADVVRTIRGYSPQGTETDLTATFRPTAGGWTVDFAGGPAATGAVPPTTTFTFDGTGKLTSIAPPEPDPVNEPFVILWDAWGTGAGTEIKIDLSGITGFSSPTGVNILSQDGAPAASLQSFTINPNGELVGIFSNGLKQTQAQLALANFNNPPGLEKVGDALYRFTVNSGLAQVNAPGSSGLGTLQSGTVEMSNVDLAQEFTNLIVAQRGFQANSKVISASDELLQDLVNLKR